MSQTGIIQVDKVTKDEFIELVAEYPSLVEAISNSKDANNNTIGKHTLKELDAYRYGEALSDFAADQPHRPVQLGDVQKLVEWKLRHGKFRPTLMKLVSSNDPRLVEDTVQNAFSAYSDGAQVSRALDILVKLRGIGPATASLLLAVHDPNRVIFFSDEAFYWLCCQGKKSPIKYNAKEYQALNSKAQALSKRLDVSAVDIEKAAFVLMRSPTSPPPSKDAVDRKQPKPNDKAMQPVTKRKIDADSQAPQSGQAPRRSKRIKKV